MTTLPGSHVVVDGAELAAWFREPSGPISMMIAERASRVQDGARAQITAGKMRHGNDSSDRLAPHILKRFVDMGDGALACLVGTDVIYYARWVHDGNGPPGGRIFANPRFAPDGRVRRLRFIASDGSVVYRTSVATSAPNRFLTDNLHLAL